MNIQKEAENFFSGACYTYCIAYLKLRVDDFARLTKVVADAYAKGYIANDGFVVFPQRYYGSRDVEKISINSLSDLPSGKVFAVEYKWNGESHFVVANRSGVVFDPWENSDTVKYGAPVSYRHFIGD